MLLKDRVDRMLGNFKEGVMCTITLNTLWPYSKGYVDVLNYPSIMYPNFSTNGYIIDAPSMPVEEFTRLINTRLVADDLTYVVEIYMEDRPAKLTLGLGDLAPGYATVIHNTRVIASGDELVQTLFI